MSERKDVQIEVPLIVAGARAPIENIAHHCPLCNKVYEFPEFVSHASACIAENADKVDVS